MSRDTRYMLEIVRFMATGRDVESACKMAASVMVRRAIK